MDNKKQQRLNRKLRQKDKLGGTKFRPRISVFRSNRRLYVQFVDDQKHTTILGMIDKVPKKVIQNKVNHALEFGKKIAQQAMKKKIARVVFDRSGYAYHGRIKALAEGMRAGGLKF